LTFVGDINQLPPVSWGGLLRSLVASQLIPIYTLTTNYRVDSASTLILENATRLLQWNEKSSAISEAVGEGKEGKFVFSEGASFAYYPGDIATVKTILTLLRESGIRYDQITVLCPYSHARFGHLHKLNTLFQELYLPQAQRFLDTKKRVWCVGERVMMVNNNYEYNIFNGEEGTVTAIDTKGLTVRFRDGVEPHFLSLSPSEEREETRHLLTLNDLDYSAAKSIYKSQGSEYDYVIGYFPLQKISRFLNRNLMYTYITRIRKAGWLVGDQQAIEACCTQSPPARVDFLDVRLRGGKPVLAVKARVEASPDDEPIVDDWNYNEAPTD
jgi:exodeoxyribonuclease V alpha subunit